MASFAGRSLTGFCDVTGEEEGLSRGCEWPSAHYAQQVPSSVHTAGNLVVNGWAYGFGPEKMGIHITYLFSS
jgi:hypothetical protein